jgi:ureidoglycolate lyase
MSVRLQIAELTPAAFAPFGRVIQRPGRTVDASGPGWQWWAETMLLATDGRPFGVGYLDLQPAALRFDWAERHISTPEMLVPLSSACLVYAGPAEPREPAGQLPPLDSFRVFRVRPGTGVVLNPGVWHGAPLAEGAATQVMCLILQHTGRDDVTLVRFPDQAVAIEG